MQNQNAASGLLSKSDGSSFRTYGASQITLHQVADNPLRSTNVHVAGKIWVGHIDPLAPGHATATLLEPLPGQKNSVIFEGASKMVDLNPNDLVELEPGSRFNIGSIVANGGIQMQMHGTVKDLRIGRGLNDLASCMPSAFDLLDARKRFFSIIPGIVTAIIGLLESLRLLPRRKIQ